MPTGIRPCTSACAHDARHATLSTYSGLRRVRVPTPRFASCAPEVIRRARNDVREELRAHSRARAVVTVHCAAVLSCRWVGRGGAITGGVRWRGSQRTSILMRPALCPPIEMSKKTTGLPPAAPGIEPIPDMAQGKSWQEQRSGGCGGQWALQKQRRRGSEGGGRGDTRRAGVRGGRPAGAALGGIGAAGKRACAHDRARTTPEKCITP